MALKMLVRFPREVLGIPTYTAPQHNDFFKHFLDHYSHLIAPFFIIYPPFFYLLTLKMMNSRNDFATRSTQFE